MSQHMGPQKAGKAHPHCEEGSALPPELAAVALVDAKACAAVGGMSVTWWYDEVQAGRAPQPAIRAPRCTRWRMTEVRDFWERFAAQGTDNDRARAVVNVAKKASAAARRSKGGVQ